jgi:glycosyltransferase involved in cell wall biosynthesis
MRDVRISWVLPPDRGGGVGGYAVAYGYANRLSDLGHDVTVIHLDPFPTVTSAATAIRWPKRLAEWLIRALPLRGGPGSAYEPRPALRRVSRPRLSRRLVAGEDAVIATEWRTAGPVVGAAPSSRGFYFIQHHETWNGPEGEVNDTWRLPLTRIVIAEWLVDVARDLGALPVHLIHNAIDPERFHVAVAPEERRPTAVAMLWHHDPWKRSRDGLAALERARAALPDLTASVISRFPPPPDMPDWVTWHRNATPGQVAQVLNRSAIFLSPSEAEGWALPSAEALACGCALVSTDIGGVAAHAKAGDAALLAPVGDVPALAAAVVRLAEDRELRLALGRAGAALMREGYSWEAATTRLERILGRRSDEAITR